MSVQRHQEASEVRGNLKVEHQTLVRKLLRYNTESGLAHLSFSRVEWSAYYVRYMPLAADFDSK